MAKMITKIKMDVSISKELIDFQILVVESDICRTIVSSATLGRKDSDALELLDNALLGMESNLDKLQDMKSDLQEVE